MAYKSRQRREREAFIRNIALTVAGVLVLVLGVWAFGIRPAQQAAAEMEAMAGDSRPDRTAGDEFFDAVEGPASKAEAVKVAVIGDSFVAGSEMGGREAKNWTQLVSEGLTTETRRVTVEAIGYGGSGYIKVGPSEKVFIDGVEGVSQEADLVVFFGSINDIDADPVKLKKAASAAYAAAMEQAPDADLLVIGPPWSRTDGQRFINERRDALKAAAQDAGADFFDPITDKWFQGEDKALIGSDKTHPTDEGHAYMADRVTPEIAKALGL